ncbi:sensor histidine kinase [Spirosoma rigui]|uniref:sensor histidine kinase n=1 Tax=Spirosoma rigui TaxID=564064 RepID=UPI0009B0F4D7|nr:histidine kinase [Spirosoma rigui]
MHDWKVFRRYELIFVLGTATLYTIRRLLNEANRFDGMITTAERSNVPAATIGRNLAAYDHILNNNVPLIAGIGLLLAAGYVFHAHAFPLIQDRTNDRKAGLYLGLSIGLLLVGVFLYQYLKLYVRYQHNTAGDVIGLKVYSLFRKRTVLANTIGLAILVGLYELAFQYYQRLVRKIKQESEQHVTRINYLLLISLCLLTANFVLTGTLPVTLWRGGSGDTLLLSGMLLQILVLQGYIYQSILPLFAESRLSRMVLVSLIGTTVLTVIVATTILWGAVTTFYYYALDPIISFSAIVLTTAFAIAYVRRLLTNEQTALKTEVSAKAAELANLRAQINPHFLFNALNSLYATALNENSEKTADGIQKLGDMMRFMLQENNLDRIPLDKEIEYLRNYIQLQRMRIDETHDIDIQVTIQEPNRALYIAPMLLTPFIENAFKHGISFRAHSWIHITLTLDDTRLYLKVHNSRHAKAVNDPEVAKPGVGLDNVRKRLDLIYPGRYQHDMQESEQDYFASLILTYW